MSSAIVKGSSHPYVQCGMLLILKQISKNCYHINSILLICMTNDYMHAALWLHFNKETAYGLHFVISKDCIQFCELVVDEQSQNRILKWLPYTFTYIFRNMSCFTVYTLKPNILFCKLLLSETERHNPVFS